MVSVLCVAENSNYFQYDLDLWTKQRNAYNFNSNNPIIAHPPCAQWSRLKGLANYNELEKQLGSFCYEKIISNGGILEHPLESSLWKYLNIKPTVNCQLNWFGFPAVKKTGLFIYGYEPLPPPFNLDAIQCAIGGSKNYKELPKKMRDKTPISMIDYFLKTLKHG